MAWVTGIGGVFFTSKGDPKALAAWYAEHLGLVLQPWSGAVLRWPEDTADDRGATVWHLAAANSTWSSPSEASFMINYRVDDMDGLVARLQAGGISLHSGPETHENGRFAWVIDPDGNKIELWEPKAWAGPGET